MNIGKKNPLDNALAITRNYELVKDALKELQTKLLSDSSKNHYAVLLSSNINASFCLNQKDVDIYREDNSTTTGIYKICKVELLYSKFIDKNQQPCHDFKCTFITDRLAVTKIQSSLGIDTLAKNNSFMQGIEAIRFADTKKYFFRIGKGILHLYFLNEDEFFQCRDLVIALWKVLSELNLKG
ncbi:hypothetical protein [Parasediminibacterium sp. JCM 36343]|uniref:hypothetical protein n=1 Tax=Parasediminibacterium sp. JCM 36343 TaxID=3374279 RepID=UPI00397CA51D